MPDYRPFDADDGGSIQETLLAPDLGATVELDAPAASTISCARQPEEEAPLPTAQPAKPTTAEELEYYRQRAIAQDIRIFEMRALLQSGKGFSNMLNSKDLLDTFMAVVREKYGVKSSAVLLRDDLDPRRDYYQVRAYHGLPDSYSGPSRPEPTILFRFERNNGLLWQLIQQGDIFSVRDMKRDPRLQTAWRQWNLGVLESDIWCPLLRGGEVLGVITLGERFDGHQIPETEYPFLQELASIAATNIDAVLKYEKNSRILRNIQTLYDINQHIANVNDFKKLCIESLSTAVDALKAQKGSLMLWNREKQQLETRVVWGNIPKHVRDSINNGMTETKAFRMGEGVAGQVALTKKPIRVNNRDEIPQVGQNVVYCICSVPILYGGEIEGVINMTNRVRKLEDGSLALDPLGRFNQDDLSLLVGLADQAAVNLHRMRNYAASITDRMTELYNTRHFENTLATEFASSLESGKPLFLAVSDIDHFKKFNDTYGHKAGDEVLKAVARVLQASRRPDRADGYEDLCFRYGGEEYCFLLPATTAAEALEVVEKYRAAVADLVVPYDGQALKVTCSVGIAGALYDTREVKELFKLADDALYACKEGGRNQIRVYLKGAKERYSPELVASVEERYQGGAPSEPAPGGYFEVPPAKAA